MEKVILLRYGELFLKGRNRSSFESALIDSIKRALAPYECNFSRTQNRYYVENYRPEQERSLVDRLTKIFGLCSLSVAVKVASDYEQMYAAALSAVPEGSKTFCVRVKRADKRMNKNSMQIAMEAGGYILGRRQGLSVDLFTPDTTVNIDIRENGCAYVYSGKVECAGGMPLGTAGGGMLLLSGGFDSPVAGYRMARRGMKITAVHYHSYPHTGLQARQKVLDIAKTMTRYCGDIRLIVVSFTKIQEEIHRRCDGDFMITVMRRVMVRIAERLAVDNGCGALITGESLGQVASQTVAGITSTEDAVQQLPVFRPLIGMDKYEIMDTAAKIGTYDISKQPYEDCCTVFLPKNPVINPKLDKARAEEAKLVDLDAMIDEAIKEAEIIEYTAD
ncbi:MAG: tRNA 4-thiouridine(8) synthase ThiI [Clostridia bacterium]|nr:tRNA 4-thiouridine(8) synthase ThiI [Clostridia bacterium]